MAPDSPLLEREGQLDTLGAMLDRAAEGEGSIVLVCGEAGIGKTTLVEAFTELVRADGTPVLRGACDALRTPRPLGPLLDIARGAGGRLRAVAEGEPARERLFGAFLDLLQRESPAVVVLEDVHWADHATLDLLTFLGRRTRETSALLIATFRDDELSVDHPLRGALATLPRAVSHRLWLPRLSPAAVEELARRAGRAAGSLHALTSGNPFYVGEVLAAREGVVPPLVQDAVFARAGDLSRSARAVLDAVAVAAGALDRRLLDEALDPDPGDVRACMDVGVLVGGDGRLSFRHELARQAWLERVDARRARRLHADFLAVLERTTERGGEHGRGAAGGSGVRDSARLVHHALGAGDEGAVRRLAPVAAAEAFRLGAYREAAAHYETTLAFAGDTDEAARAALLEAVGEATFLSGDTRRAESAFEEALAIRRALGDPWRQSEDDRWLARLAWFRGDDAAVRRRCDAAIEVAEPLGESPELARAYALRSQILMCAEESEPAVEWGERALAMARAVGDRETLTHSLINVGCALLMAGDSSGRDHLERALDLARRHGLRDAEARVLTNDAEIAVDWRDLGRADSALEVAIGHCSRRDMDVYTLCGMGARALLRLWRGEWGAAAADAATILDHPRVPPVDRIPALAVLGLLRARRGDPGVWPALDEAHALAAPTAEPHRIAPVAAARAEAAWLEDDLLRVLDELRAAHRMASERSNPWPSAELAFWLWKADALEPPPRAPGDPFGLHMAGDPAAAAEAWGRMGFAYHRALALADCPTPDAGREAVRILRDLGADRAAERVASGLRQQGVRRLPRGPRAATRENPAGLTPRQLQVLELLAEGLSNLAIARRLHLSPKTVEHHVSAVLSKLDVRSRTEAALRAAELTGMPGSAHPT